MQESNTTQSVEFFEGVITNVSPGTKLGKSL